MKHVGCFIVTMFFVFSIVPCRAAEEGTVLEGYPLKPVSQPSVIDTDSTVKPRKRDLFHRIGDVFTGFFKEFNNPDTAYIEPQRYNFTALIQNTNTYEVYRLTSKQGQSITFAPEMSYRIGPYIGWRWVFLGYTIDVNHLNASSRHSSKREYDLSLYSSLLGLDFFWRETGNDYKIRQMYLGEDIDTSPLKNMSFDGFKASIKGFNLYYIFNHKKFSYPAAYSQSTVQRRSAGSALMGIGYTRHSLNIDWDKLDKLLDDKLSNQTDEVEIDNGLLFGKVTYTDISVSGGYSYNWVFARNWLFNASLSAAIGYKVSKGDMEKDKNGTHRGFNIHNFNMDGIGRFGLVWNNTHWYAGASAILHSYNYSKDQFSTNNFFGSLNFYVGVNFGRKK